MSLASIARVVGPRTRWGDHLYNWLRFRQKHGRNPRRGIEGSYIDHLYHLKVDGSLLDPLRQFVSDKEYVKRYISAAIGPQFTVETIAVLKSDSDIDRFTLPHMPCVVKPTHLSGRVSIHSTHEREVNRGQLKAWLGTNYYLKQREQNYRYLRPKIIVEEFFSPDGTTVPGDYKIFCFFGTPRFIQFDIDRFGRHFQNYYDTEWNKLVFSYEQPGCERPDPEPRALSEMLAIAARLSQGFSFVRVDMYAMGIISDSARIGVDGSGTI